MTREYDLARQQQGQLAEEFASYLTDMKEYFGDYTEKQRVRHLLAKLREETVRTMIALCLNCRARISFIVRCDLKRQRVEGRSASKKKLELLHRREELRGLRGERATREERVYRRPRAAF